MERKSVWGGQVGVTLTVGVVLVLLNFLIPLLLLLGGESAEPAALPLPTATLPMLPTAEREGAEPLAGWDRAHTIRLLRTDGTIQDLTMEEYLWGVTAAEMPASFQLEALKAQTVAARTYALRQQRWGTDKHPDADVCGDYTCCQAYLTREQAMESWGTEGERYAQKISDAVTATDGLLCLYEGQPIDALFFSSAAGVTSDAVAVWGAEIPYLKSVSSPEGEEVPGWRTLVTFTPAEFAERFSATWSEADFSAEPSLWFSEPILDEYGAVAQITVGGVTVTGIQARQVLGLRSAHFTVEEATETRIALQVTGYGHGVGMSQYGANALAAEGKGFEEILKWYYTDITVEVLGE